MTSLDGLAARLECTRPGRDADLGGLRALVAGDLCGLWAAVRAQLQRACAVVVHGVPTESDGVLLALALATGTPDASGNGGRLIYDVRPRPLTEQGDVSTTREAFALHSDSTALVRPHDTVYLACVAAAHGRGGESRVMSAEHVRASLPARAIAALEEPIFPFALNDPLHGRGVRRAPVLQGDAIRYRRDALELGERACGEALPARARTALDALEAVLAEEEHQLAFGLRPGDVLVVDNRRALHGRTAFARGADRHLRRLKTFACS